MTKSYARPTEGVYVLFCFVFSRVGPRLHFVKVKQILKLCPQIIWIYTPGGDGGSYFK